MVEGKHTAEQQARMLGRGDRATTPLRLIVAVSIAVACVAAAIMLVAFLIASNA